jgi:hypothetical protein
MFPLRNGATSVAPFFCQKNVMFLSSAERKVLSFR